VNDARTARSRERERERESQPPTERQVEQAIRTYRRKAAGRRHILHWRPNIGTETHDDDVLELFSCETTKRLRNNTVIPAGKVDIQIAIISKKRYYMHCPLRQKEKAARCSATRLTIGFGAGGVNAISEDSGFPYLHYYYP